MLPEALFQPENSEHGRKKRAWLDSNKVLCLHNESAIPPWRLTWEQIQEHISTHNAYVAKEMRKAKCGAELGDAYERMDITSPEALFVEGALKMCAVLCPRFNPEHGCDLDLFINVLHVDRPEMSRVHLEIFPRIALGEPSTAFVSLASVDVPLYLNPDEEREPYRSPTTTFILSDALGEGEDIYAVGARWDRHSGPWYMRSKHIVDLFINRALVSLIEFGREDDRCVINPGVSRSFNGTVEKAEILFHQLGPRSA